ncbi:Aquaporin-12A [Harpegnathos saltator]|uniref:Aquaporin n=1 Tax=Harpegnathos saltator TaxID=610380 RepID=E2BGZ1_HARSA|nr:Aquaporin-12A [Harpegnathos saltator]
MPATIIALAVSTLYIVFTVWLAHWLRLYATYFIEQPLVKSLFLEAIATAELCGACFELIIIADNWGVSMYAIYLFVLTVYWSMTWGDASACPYTHLEDMVLGNKSVRIAFLLIWAEFLGGIAVFKYIQVLWALEIVSTHKNRAFGDCTTDLQARPSLLRGCIMLRNVMTIPINSTRNTVVPVLIGALIECVATCICRVVSRVLGDLNPRFSTVIDSFVGTSLVVAGRREPPILFDGMKAFNYSGGYFNPALATSLKCGCLGTTFIEHVTVYWIGACVGSIASLRVYKMPFVQNFVEQRKEKIA